MKSLVRWFRSLRNYFIESWGELRKVTWPSRKELWNSTITVLVVIVLVGIFLGVVDLLLTFIMGLYLR
ncbi:MAG: preprotein translocase subunit SecE [Candidatus Caldatribacterium sp.]|uniref:preprotein translocase subunit SecE n=1 Tax=Candidatus Caldatribacterium sp. TaxID=2282143 RepID=UPI00299C44B9|nr:preprotein translocase subunit SecE [Candidatus Caldatribacterium sp.]MCX7729866.1 preprotein translocase subunit SecE [Candidatus Caldatribacterium sp.]MDW8082051.1 preprotein translocase subunit SecE [Candidatus Calescibacterium sp.]